MFTMVSVNSLMQMGLKQNFVSLPSQIHGNNTFLINLHFSYMFSVIPNVGTGILNVVNENYYCLKIGTYLLI